MPDKAERPDHTRCPAKVVALMPACTVHLRNRISK